MVETFGPEPNPGPVVLFGSGETSPSGRKVFEAIFKKLPPSPRLALLETPAGFELNSDRVVGRIAAFIKERLQNYHPEVVVIPARKRGTSFSPDDEGIVSPLLEADLIFMGPGSPTYAVRQLEGSLAWNYLLARHQLGATVALASSAVVAISAYSLPVYEIYKVGQDLHWKAGLDLFGLYGLPIVFIPHWNNQDGGEELDTSRCFMGKPRFFELMQMLPANLTVIGIDEKTALVIDLQSAECRVIGMGGVTLIHTGHQHGMPGPDLRGSGLAEVAEHRVGHVHIYQNGETFPLYECCPFDLRMAVQGLPAATWKRALEIQGQIDAERAKKEQPDLLESNDAHVPETVQALVEKRQEARMLKDWKAADAIRNQIAELGWTLVDTPEGPRVTPV